jgi:sugar phosphate isomerase/epimerase
LDEYTAIFLNIFKSGKQLSQESINKLGEEFSVSHYICPDNVGFIEFLDIIQNYGFKGVGLTERVFKETSLSSIKNELKSRDLFISSINSAGYFYHPNSKLHDAQLNKNKYLLECASELGNSPLNIIVGGQNVGSGGLTLDQSRDYIFDRLEQYSYEAQSLGVSLLLEPIHPVWTWSKSCINSINEAVDIVNNINSIKINLDLFHTYWDSDFLKFLESDNDNIGLIQICDVIESEDTNSLHRVALGQGFLNLETIFQITRRKNKKVSIEIEYFNNKLNGLDFRDLFKECVAYLNRLV